MVNLIHRSVLTEPEPHSSIVGFITTFSYSSFKDIHFASKFKNQENSSIKDKEFRNSDIKNSSKSNKEVFSSEIVSLRSILWEIVSLDEKEKFTSFQDDTKYEHVGQDTISQDGKDVKDNQGKDLKISD
ncbi:hypothetical protein Tco_0308775 [Tanacetum coccineum]